MRYNTTYAQTPSCLFLPLWPNPEPCNAPHKTIRPNSRLYPPRFVPFDRSANWWRRRRQPRGTTPHMRGPQAVCSCHYGRTPNPATRPTRRFGQNPGSIPRASSLLTGLPIGGAVGGNREVQHYICADPKLFVPATMAEPRTLQRAPHDDSAKILSPPPAPCPFRQACQSAAPRAATARYNTTCARSPSRTCGRTLNPSTCSTLRFGQNPFAPKGSMEALHAPKWLILALMKLLRR